MVILNRIYTRTGDQGTTALAAGGRRPKHDLRIEAYGTVDETNACLGLVRLHTVDHEIDPVLARIQNDLFDLGSDLATVDTGKARPREPLRITAAQTERLEREIDEMNGRSRRCAPSSCRAGRKLPPTFISPEPYAGVPSGSWWPCRTGRMKRSRRRRSDI